MHAYMMHGELLLLMNSRILDRVGCWLRWVQAMLKGGRNGGSCRHAVGICYLTYLHVFAALEVSNLVDYAGVCEWCAVAREIECESACVLADG